MLEFILQIILMIGLSGMVFIAAKAIPRVPEKDDNEARFEDFIKSLPLDRIDDIIRTLLHKGLRRFRLLLLKVDNKIGSYLEKTKDSSDVSDRSVDKLLSKTK